MTALTYDETMSDWRTHDGIDIEAKYGTVVSAMASGTVTKVYYDDLYGTTVVTEREDGLRCTYANLESIPTVNVGDQVSVGDTIGSVGDSAGCESAQESHLHLSVAASGQSVSPLDYLPQKIKNSPQNLLTTGALFGTMLLAFGSWLRREQHGGIAQLARAFGSYPKCPRFESRCRYQGDAAPAASHLRPVGQVVKTPPFHGGNMGSSPVRVTIWRLSSAG